MVSLHFWIDFILIGSGTAVIHLPNWVTKSWFFCQIATFSLLTQKLFNRFAQNFQVNCAFRSNSDNPCNLLFWRHLAEINAKKQPELAQNSKGWRGFLTITSKLSYGFSQFLHFSCLQSQEIQRWYSYWATMFEWPRKSKSTSGSKGTDDNCHINCWNFQTTQCFRGQGIHCWYFYRTTLFDLPQKSRSTSGSWVPQRYW